MCDFFVRLPTGRKWSKWHSALRPTDEENTSRKEYLKRREQEQVEAKAVLEARKKAFDAVVKANPELYKKLEKALHEARDTYSEMDTRYRNKIKRQLVACTIG